jgi:hypothetical protein
MQSAQHIAAEEDGSESLWVRDLALIRTSYGRLVFLAGLRNQDTGRYEHYSASSYLTSNLVASRTIKRVHENIFREWVSLPLQDKKRDIESYINGIAHVGKAALIDTWLRLTPYMNLVPGSVQGPERQKHISDFEAILGLLKNVYGVASPNQGA